MTNPLKIEHDVPLAPMTTLGIGGPAKHFIRAQSEGEIAAAVKFAHDAGLDLFILGGGSNVLIADSGFDGVTVQVGLSGMEMVDEGDNKVTVTAAAGEDWDTFVEHCVGHGLAGLECLSGIPGLVGGTPVQNVGAYGQEVAETIVSVRCFDRRSKSFVTLSNAECGFAYRTSIFNTTQRDRYIVINVTYSLVQSGAPKVVYKDLVEHFGDRRPTTAEVREAVLSIRRSKSMVIDADDPNSKSAGSFFKNPIVSRPTFETIKSGHPGKQVPSFDAGEMVKIPAAWLIENSGFNKGFALGEAGISSKHTLALINRGHATAADVVSLKNKIQHAVKQRFGIELQPEPIFVGF